jgi:uncharacterized protein YycO
MIRIQIVAGGSLIDRTIQFQTRSWANHVEFVRLDNEHPVETLGARPSGGIQVRPANDRYTKIEQFVLNDASSEYLLGLAWDWLSVRKGTPYNFRGVLGVATDLNIADPNAMDCSQAVHLACWHGADFPLLSTRPSNLPWRITPRDLLLSRGLVFVK